jgi:carboxyl-terminal processing protease
MKKMVLDLRGNGGGLMDAATNIADEFLKNGALIVYTKGRADGEQRTTATKNGKLEDLPLTVLVDENSASASEILAGALQDNDRATIVGRRTFGKGLVQIQQALNDGSAFRLTIARYYTPTGRCIQKPYDKGLEAYQEDEYNRYKNGELYNRDSIHLPDSLQYKTPKGRIVYGGGGIMPDSFVPFDSIGETHYLDQLFRKDIFVMWALDMSMKQGKQLKEKGEESFRKEFVVNDEMFNALLMIADRNGMKRDPSQINRSRSKIERYMKANLARLLWDDEAYTMIINGGDPTVLNALNSFE